MHRVLGARAADAAGFAGALRNHDRAWGSSEFELAGGHVALWGAGMYVNRALAVGHVQPMTAEQFDRLEATSRAVGVAAAIEVSPATRHDVVDFATSRGYVPEGSVVVHRRGVDDIDESPSETGFLIEPAANRLGIWQETSASGWGHVTQEARRAGDAYAAVASRMDGDGFVLARDAVDGRPVGCATVTITGAVATLGGMSTVPPERGRGVHRALIRHRLLLARGAGCEIATTSAIPGGSSDRNLRRHGFTPWFEIQTLVLRSPSG